MGLDGQSRTPLAKKPAKIHIGSLRYFDVVDLSRSKASAGGSESVVLRYAKRANPAANIRAANATAVLNPPVNIPMSNPQTVAKFTNVNPPESHFIELDLDLGSAPAPLQPQ